MMELRWEDFHRASWEENADAPFAKPDQIMGMAFGVGTPPDAPNVSTVWVDDLALMGLSASPAESVPQESAPSDAPEEPAQVEQPRRPSLPCAGALILPMSMIAGLSTWSRKRR
jgi:hypothetical protein